jgi:hypothetical protein
MTAQNEESGPPTPVESTLEGVGEPAEERTMVELPPAVDPELVDRMQQVQKEIAEDERALDDLPGPNL